MASDAELTLTRVTPLPATTVANGSGAWLTRLGGWRVLAAIGFLGTAAVLAFAPAGTATRLLPLLFVLPCAAMMLMCMRHAGNHRQEPGKPGTDADAPASDRQA